jgi:hypothetical protein
MSRELAIIGRNMALKEFKTNSIPELLKKLPTVCEPEKTEWNRGHADHTWPPILPCPEDGT